jgi:hypothetical protein
MVELVTLVKLITMVETAPYSHPAPGASGKLQRTDDLYEILTSFKGL